MNEKIYILVLLVWLKKKKKEVISQWMLRPKVITRPKIDIEIIIFIYFFASCAPFYSLQK